MHYKQGTGTRQCLLSHCVLDLAQTENIVKTGYSFFYSPLSQKINPQIGSTANNTKRCPPIVCVPDVNNCNEIGSTWHNVLKLW